jgi:cobalamin biosynthesis protein CobT
MTKRMASAQQELELFAQFVQHRLSAGDGPASLDELFDLWRHENPSDELYAENVAAIAASIDDFKRDERDTSKTLASAQPTGQDL